MGASQNEIVAFLGKPEKEFSDPYLDQTTLYYPQKDLEIQTNLSGKTTEIIFVGDASVNPTPKNDLTKIKVTFSSFAANPDKTNWRASRESVINAYGKPDAEQKSSDYPSTGGFFEVDLLRYGSTWLYFKDNKLYKIIMSGK